MDKNQAAEAAREYSNMMALEDFAVREPVAHELYGTTTWVVSVDKAVRHLLTRMGYYSPEMSAVWSELLPLLEARVERINSTN
jgi:hypothetical protein